MESQIITWIIGGLWAVALWFGKSAMDSFKNEIKTLHDEVKYIKEVYFKKEDFKEFKSDLWKRLDILETTIARRLDSKE